MRNKLNIFGGGYMPWYPRNWWSNIRYFFRTIKWAWQRATKGYSDYDTWDLDVYYSRLIIASLSQFRAETIGCPAYMNGMDEWYEILDKIIFLFKQANEDEPLEEKNDLAEWYEEYLENNNYSEKPSEDVLNKRRQYYQREEELYQIRAQKRKEAFELLAEYFGHLWW